MYLFIYELIFHWLHFNHVISLNSVFKVTDWPKEDYGKFYSGDSYIILNTYKEKESDEVQLNVMVMCYDC